jgi:CheY-like chemotaxis protein
MRHGFNILVADRNRHVRELLQRELKADGYLIQVAKDCREVLENIAGGTPPDLLILDLDIPYSGGTAILDILREKSPNLPIVIHTFLPEYSNGLTMDGCATLIEKSGNTDCLKAAVLDMLKKYYPERFHAMRMARRQLESQIESAGEADRRSANTGAKPERDDKSWHDERR